MKTFQEFMLVVEGLDMKTFKANRRKTQRAAATSDARKRGHEGSEWHNSGRTYSPDEAKSRRANMSDYERQQRHQTADDPDSNNAETYPVSKKKNPTFIKSFNLFTLPFLGISLYFIINFLDSINLEIFIALIIIFFSLLNINRKKFNILKKLSTIKQNFLLSLIGIIHGLTNLGGSLLTILSSVINKDDKFKTTYCIAYGYLIMGIIQLLVIFFFSNHHIKLSNLGYILLVFAIYFPSQKIFYLI